MVKLRPLSVVGGAVHRKASEQPPFLERQPVPRISRDRLRASADTTPDRRHPALV